MKSAVLDTTERRLLQRAAELLRNGFGGVDPLMADLMATAAEKAAGGPAPPVHVNGTSAIPEAVAMLKAFGLKMVKGKTGPVFSHLLKNRGISFTVHEIADRFGCTYEAASQTLRTLVRVAAIKKEGKGYRA